MSASTTGEPVAVHNTNSNNGLCRKGPAGPWHNLFLRAETIFLVYVFTKGEFEDVPPDKRKVIRRLVEEIKKEFER